MDQQAPNQSDKKVVLLFLGITLAVLAVLIGASVGGYYVLKKTDVVERFKAELVKTPSPVGADSAQPDATNDVKADAKAQVEIVVTEPKQPSPPAVQKVCYSYTIYEGQFKSSKCYTRADYEALGYYFNKYTSAEFSKESAESTIEFTCDNDFFKDTCDKAKKQKRQAESDIANYAKELNALISRGW